MTQEIVSSCDVGGDTLEELLLLFPDNFCADGDITDLTQEQTAAGVLSAYFVLT